VQLSEPVAEATHGSFSIPIENPSAGEGRVGVDGVSLLQAGTPSSNDTHLAKTDRRKIKDMPMKSIGAQRPIGQYREIVCAERLAPPKNEARDFYGEIRRRRPTIGDSTLIGGPDGYRCKLQLHST
jgi:hypothetical protein